MKNFIKHMTKYTAEFLVFFLVFTGAFLMYHTAERATEFIYYNF